MFTSLGKSWIMTDVFFRKLFDFCVTFFFFTSHFVIPLGNNLKIWKLSRSKVSVMYLIVMRTIEYSHHA
jgi:hypothetical protein